MVEKEQFSSSYIHKVMFQHQHIKKKSGIKYFMKSSLYKIVKILSFGHCRTHKCELLVLVYPKGTQYLLWQFLDILAAKQSVRFWFCNVNQICQFLPARLHFHFPFYLLGNKDKTSTLSFASLLWPVGKISGYYYSRPSWCWFPKLPALPRHPRPAITGYLALWSLPAVSQAAPRGQGRDWAKGYPNTELVKQEAGLNDN